MAGGLLLSNMVDIVMKKTITSLLRLLTVGMLSTNPLRSIDGKSFGYYQTCEYSLLEGLISLTKSRDVLGKRLGYWSALPWWIMGVVGRCGCRDANHNAIDDELRVDIMRVMLEKNAEL